MKTLFYATAIMASLYLFVSQTAQGQAFLDAVYHDDVEQVSAKLLSNIDTKLAGFKKQVTLPSQQLESIQSRLSQLEMKLAEIQSTKTPLPVITMEAIVPLKQSQQNIVPTKQNAESERQIELRELSAKMNLKAAKLLSNR